MKCAECGRYLEVAAHVQATLDGSVMFFKSKSGWLCSVECFAKDLIKRQKAEAAENSG